MTMDPSTSTSTSTSWYPRLIHCPRPLYLYLMPVARCTEADQLLHSLSDSETSSSCPPDLSSFRQPAIDTFASSGGSAHFVCCQADHQAASVAAGYLYGEMVRRGLPCSIQHDVNDAHEAIALAWSCWRGQEDTTSAGSLAIAFVGESEMVESMAALLGTLDARAHLHFNRYNERSRRKRLHKWIEEDMREQKPKPDVTSEPVHDQKIGNSDYLEEEKEHSDNRVESDAKERSLQAYNHNLRHDEDERDAADSKLVYSTHAITSKPLFTPLTIVEYQLSLSTLHGIHHDPLVLYHAFRAKNAEEMYQNEESARMCTPSATSFNWASLLPATILSMLKLPNITLPPLRSLHLPSLKADHISAMSRHCRTFTRNGVHSIFHMQLMPVELRPKEQSRENYVDDEFIQRSLTRLSVAGVTHYDNFEAEAEFGQFSTLSQRHCLSVVEYLTRSRVINAFSSSGQTVYFNDSDLGQTTARFIRKHTALQVKFEFVSFKAALRCYTRLMSHTPGHNIILIGSYSDLWPLCLLLVNGDTHGESIAPKEEIKALFERARHSILNLQVWNPSSGLNKSQVIVVNSHLQHQPQPEPVPETAVHYETVLSRDALIMRWARQRTHTSYSYHIRQSILSIR